MAVALIPEGSVRSLNMSVHICAAVRDDVLMNRPVLLIDAKAC